MFIQLPFYKYLRHQPEILRGSPVVGFVNLRGEVVPFRRRQWLAPVIDVPAPKPPKPPAKRHRKPVKLPSRPKQPAPLPKGWVRCSDVLSALRQQYPDYDLDQRSAGFQGFLYTGQGVRRTKADALFRFSIWPKPELPKKDYEIVGFNLYAMVKVNPNSPTRRKGTTDPYVFGGSSVSWNGPLSVVQQKIYDRNVVQGYEGAGVYQKVVSHRTMIDVLALQFFERIGTPEEIVAVQFRTGFTGKEWARMSKKQKEYQAERNKRRRKAAKKKQKKGRRK